MGKPKHKSDKENQSWKFKKAPIISASEYKALRTSSRIKRDVSRFQEIVIKLMNERGLKDSDVVKATGLAYSTWHEWISGETTRQIVDENLFKVMKFFNVPLHYLCFGIGKPEPVFNVNEKENASSGVGNG